MKVSHGRNSIWRIWGRSHREVLLTGLPLMTFSAYVLIAPRTTSHSGSIHSNLGPPHKSRIKKMPPWACPQASLGQAFSQPRFLQLHFVSNWQRAPITIGPLTQRHASIQLQPFLPELSPRWCANIKIIIQNISTFKTVFKSSGDRWESLEWSYYFVF